MERVQVNFYEQVEDDLLKFAVIISKTDGKWVFCKHKERDTYEIPGGHREAGETIYETAERELREETGAIDFDIKPICVYSVKGKTRINEKSDDESFGMLFVANIFSFEKELHSEIEKIVVTHDLVDNWTYPLIQPKLLEEAKKRGYFTDYEYIEATEELLKRIWEKNIKSNSDDERWIKWREEALSNNASGKSKTFLVLYRGEPVGEGTLLFADECSAISGRRMLADGKETANINALRIEKDHEGKGHVSKLVNLMEQYALKCGYKKLTIGVEAKETRNLAIYLHWKYNELVHAETEDGSLVLYYAKSIVERLR